MNRTPQKMCRICEKQTAAELINMALENNFQSFIPKFLACADVTFDITDELPKYFCRNCTSKLNVAYNFKIKCEETQEKFQKLLQCKMPSAAVSSLISLKEENAEVPISNENNTVDTNFTLEQIFGYSSNLLEVQIEPSELKLEYNNLQSIDINCHEKDEGKTEKLDLIDENYQYIVYESTDDKTEVIMETCPISSQELKLKSFRHTKEKHTNVTYRKCKLCDKTFVNSSSLSLHMKRKHSKVQPPIERNVNDNKLYVNKITAYECFMCKKTFTQKRYLATHVKRVHISNELKPQHVCEICGKNFHCNANKRRHIKVIHLNERSFVCRVCGHRFGSFYELENHEPIHSDERNIECTHCTGKFKTKLHLRQHFQISHNTTDRAPVSKELKVFTDEDRLKHEIAIVQKRRDYNDTRRECCEICGKTMACGNIKRHMLMHSGIRPFKCELCPKTFFKKIYLNYHILVHTGEKPYKCEICSKAFRQKCHLLSHRLTHTGEKPYKCRFCEKAFSIPGNLKEHERLHTGEKPYQCNLCVEKFANSTALKRHAKTAHDGRESEALIYAPPQY